MLKLAKSIGDKLAGVSSVVSSAKVTTPQPSKKVTHDDTDEPIQPVTPVAGYITFEIKPYKENELGVSHREGFLANFSSIQEPIIFSVRWNRWSIRLFMHTPAKYQGYVESVFYATFSSSDITILQNHISHDTAGHTFIKFSNECEFYDSSEFSKGGAYVDPFKDVLSIYSSIPEEAELVVQYTNKFDVKESGRKKFMGQVKKFFSYFTGKKDEKEKSKEEIKDEKHAQQIKKSGRDVLFSVSYKINNLPGQSGEQLNKNILNVFDKFLYEGSLKPVKEPAFVNANINAFVNFFHLPTKANLNTALHYTEYRKLPFPTNVPTRANSGENEITLLWYTDHKDKAVKFGIRKEDKFRHVYIVGKTGMGKSTLISNMVRSDMITNNGCAVLDPHGDLVEDVMAHLPSRRTNDVIIFDVSDTANPVGFNILEYNHPEQKNLIASGVVSIFKKLYENSWGPRLEYILRNVMLSIMEYPNATLMHVVRMLTDKPFREEVLSYVTDSVVLKFRRDEYDKWNDNQRNEAVGPITNKIGQFLSSPIVRNIFAQPKSKINLREIMDQGKILLINLSKWKIGEDNASMIGSFLVSKFQIDAMSRADMDFRDRRDFYLYIDEFQNFATDSFENILSEARKYRLSLIVANQFTSQIQENVRDAIFGNVGTIVSFGLWYDDATIMSSQFKELITPNDLLSLPKFKGYIKLMIDGVTADPFSMTTFPLPQSELSKEIKDKIKAQSRQRYSMDRDKLEKLLKVRYEKKFTAAEKIAEQAQAEAKATAGDWPAFSSDDVKIWSVYEGYVKLKYNYGIFVTVKGVEWLLHKSQIKIPANLPPEQRKDLYQIGDRISVKAQEFKEIDGVKRVVWSQL